MQPVSKLPTFNIILKNDDNISYSEIIKALKLIFNLTEAEAGEKAITANASGMAIIEQVHKEKLELREQQIRAWNEHGGATLPFKIVRVA